MNTTPTSAPGSVAAPLRLGVHLLIAAAVAIVSPFTGLAWPFAIGVGSLLGATDARRMRGEPVSMADSVAVAFLGAVGVLAMLFFGAFVGGLIAIVVVALAAFSEKAAADASPIDRGVARILLFVVPLLAVFFVLPLLGMNLDVRIGS